MLSNFIQWAISITSFKPIKEHLISIHKPYVELV